MQNHLESRESEKEMQQPLTCVEICAGAGGQALGLAMAGFAHVALVEYEKDYCAVLKQNRPEWNVICADVYHFDDRPYKGADLLVGGVPCPPFSVAGKLRDVDVVVTDRKPSDKWMGYFKDAGVKCLYPGRQS